MAISKRVVLHFPSRSVDQPIIYRLVRDYNLVLNILKASVTPKEEGIMVLELSGARADYDKGIRYLQEAGVRIQSLGQDIMRNDARCTHCGACVVICPTGALALDPKTRMVDFYEDKCTACELCVLPCPPRAMEVYF
ncbi:MAG: 4Fe-4S dicluster domain-containing protein [Dehalococcoidia bacterium]|nr:4Fe-4S dicluster domain-containing protein [Dehalococcoidia bacterium]TEU02702.1 MAG: 4Fe-4S dicluster domain-containing protein [Dehalococcoidia bacterium]